MEFSISFDPFHVRIGINIHHTAFLTLVIISFIIETFTLIQGDTVWRNYTPIT